MTAKHDTLQIRQPEEGQLSSESFGDDLIAGRRVETAALSSAHDVLLFVVGARGTGWLFVVTGDALVCSYSVRSRGRVRASASAGHAGTRARVRPEYAAPFRHILPEKGITGAWARAMHPATRREVHETRLD